jgi:crossover junction endonuclease MUS81
MEIVVDVRENSLISLLTGCKTEQLVIGDIEFRQQDGRPCLYVERKTVADLSASIADGRFREQRQRLIETAVPAIYLIEGSQSAFETQRIPEKSLHGALDNLILYYRIPVVYTGTLQETARWLKSAYEKLQKAPVSSSDSSIEPKRKKAKVAERLWEHQLMMIEGISGTVAQALAAVYPTPRSLVEACQHGNELMFTDIPNKKRRLGQAVSKRVYELYSREDA